MNEGKTSLLQLLRGRKECPFNDKKVVCKLSKSCVSLGSPVILWVSRARLYSGVPPTEPLSTDRQVDKVRQTIKDLFTPQSVGLVYSFGYIWFGRYIHSVGPCGVQGHPDVFPTLRVPVLLLTLVLFLRRLTPLDLGPRQGPWSPKLSFSVLFRLPLDTPSKV